MGSFAGFDNVFLGQLGPSRVVDGFVPKVSGELAEVDADGSANDSPYAYHLAWFRKEHMLTGLTRPPTGSFRYGSMRPTTPETPCSRRSSGPTASS